MDEKLPKMSIKTRSRVHIFSLELVNSTPEINGIGVIHTSSSSFSSVRGALFYKADVISHFL